MDTKTAKEKFVQTTTGSSNAFVCQTLAAIACYFWIRELGLLTFKTATPKHRIGYAIFFDFVSMALPMTQSISSVYGEFPLQFCFLFMVHMPTLWRYLFSEQDGRLRKRRRLVPVEGNEEPEKTLSGVAALEPYVVTSYRGIIVLFTALCILAVDFPFFPREMAKTVEQGYSVMDLGVGAFVIANGLVAPQAKEKGRSSLSMVVTEIKESFILILLGFGRFVFVTLTNYQSPEEEYGKHWNFFCTLAVIKIFGRLAAVIVRAEFLPLFGVALSAGYEVILQNGLYDAVLVPSAEIPTNGFLSRLIVDNRSGLASSIGFLALFLIWTQFGRCFRVIRKSRWEHFRLVGDLLCWCLLGVVLCHFLPLPSRRLANAAYVLWTSYIALAFLASLVLARMMSVWIAQNEKTEAEGESLLHSLSRVSLSIPALNYNALAMFLLANVMTGCVNLCIDTMTTSNLEGRIIVSVYSLVICTVASTLHMAKVRLRFHITDLRQLRRVLCPQIVI